MSSQVGAASVPSPMRTVEGKVAFITGGDSGIGLGIARALVTAGMKVVITYMSRSHIEEAMNVLTPLGGARVHAIRVDVTDRAQVECAARETIRVFDRVHVLINNAGVAPSVPLCNATFDDFDWCMAVNVSGVFNGIHTFLPLIRAHNEGGHIVSTASVVGGVIVGPYWGIYSTSKFAVVGMMEALRSELARTNIGVSVFCPAAVSSNIGESDRNRPPILGRTGVPDVEQKASMDHFNRTVEDIIASNPDSELMMDPLQAGQFVLDGIRRNDLYIFSHPEYVEAIRDRHEALLSAIARSHPSASKAREALASSLRNGIYRTGLC